jgi:two-component system C4-dicarboxylate transport response regulator DctD
VTKTVLVVDDDRHVRDAIAQSLELADFAPISCNSFVAAKDHITPDFDGVILSDIRMPGRDGFHLLDYAQGVDAQLPVILLTGEGDIPMAVSAISKGAFDFLEKPTAPKDLIRVIERAAQSRALVIENRKLRAQLMAGDPASRLIFGVSEQAETLRQKVRQAAEARTDVLIVGPPGSGIPKVAETIHLSSLFSKAPFVKRSAASMDAATLDQAFRDAEAGTLFMDEIGLLSPALQSDVLERSEKPGAPIVIGGTTVDLAQAVANGQFNADLYYRLDVMRVRIPAIAERPEDIPVMFRHYAEQAAEQAGVALPEIDADLIARLMAQDWPGNARALMNAAMRFVLGVEEDVATTDASLGLAERMAQVEQSLLIDALRKSEGRATEAAKQLKLPRKTFYDKLTKYGIRAEDYR